MISKPEFVANSNELNEIGAQHAVEMEKRLAPITTQEETLRAARVVQLSYHDAVRQHVMKSLNEVGQNAVQHYARITGLPETTVDLNDLIKEQLTTKYYGITLEERLEISKRFGHYNLTRSGHVGATLETRKRNLVRFFLESFPFGAQVSYDRRIILSEAVRLEHMVALTFAAHSGVELVRWKLAHTHVKKDICDILAARVNVDAEQYMEEQGLKIDAAGVYLLYDVPDPPHPNCQCTLEFIRERRALPTAVKRPITAIRRLLQRIFRR